MTINDDLALATFRGLWTGPQTLTLLAQHGGRLCIDWPVGVGKSHNLDALVEAAVRGDAYDLVVVLSPTRLLVQERQWVRRPPSGLPVINLRPRPKKRCGSLNSAWEKYEQAGLGVLGRDRLCGSCPRRRDCHWPGQYGEGLNGARVIYGTQAHLARSPAFIDQLKAGAGAKRVLVVLDEVDCLLASARRQIVLGDLVRFTNVLRQLAPGPTSRGPDWLHYCQVLLGASTSDLRDPDWRLPPFDPAWALAVQVQGWNDHGDKFRFLGYDLRQFGDSPLQSRERIEASLIFATPPAVAGDFVLYSGTADPELATFRLGRSFARPFSGYHFWHSGTAWYNVASKLGMKAYFQSNKAQILDFFAGLVAERIRQGRHPLLVAKQCFVNDCAQGMQDRLRRLGLRSVRVLTGPWRGSRLKSPGVVPLIHYGTIGTNLFEAFDCAYCLTGYYVNEDIVNQVLQDGLASDQQVPLRIRTEGHPRRRKASVTRSGDAVCDVGLLAQRALIEQEMGVVVQAVGRVRPYTRPCEVVTFQCGALPRGAYTREFDCLDEARKFFGILTLRESGRQETEQRVRDARHAGLTAVEAAAQNGLSLRTVRRYWNAAGAVNPGA